MARPVLYRHPPAKPEPVVEVEAKPTDANTKDEIVRYLRAQGVDATTRMTKAELLELVS